MYINLSLVILCVQFKEKNMHFLKIVRNAWHKSEFRTEFKKKL